MQLKHNFLLDENIDIVLYKHLRDNGYDLCLVSKGSTDKTVAILSNTQKRVLVTNDSDFLKHYTTQLFGLVLLKIPMKLRKQLVVAFDTLQTLGVKLSNNVVILYATHYEVPKQPYGK